MVLLNNILSPVLQTICLVCVLSRTADSLHIRVPRGIYSHESSDELLGGGGGGHGHGATSYQNVKIENYHAVPVYIKHGHEHGHEEPEHHGSQHKIGSVHHNVKVQHGDKHDPGHAIISSSYEGKHGGEHENIAVGGVSSGHFGGGQEHYGGFEESEGHNLGGGDEQSLEGHSYGGEAEGGEDHSAYTFGGEGGYAEEHQLEGLAGYGYAGESESQHQ